MLAANLPLLELPLETVLEQFNIFILPIFTYGLPLYINNCSNSTLQSIDATFSKFLKRYLQIPSHSNNAIVHFITSTIPLSDQLMHLAPHTTHAISFPPDFDGYQLSFLSSHAFNGENIVTPIIESIPSAFWMSRNIHAIPTQKRIRRRLCREIFDTEHYLLCMTTTFHPYPTLSCLCKYCNNHAHFFVRIWIKSIVAEASVSEYLIVVWLIDWLLNYVQPDLTLLGIPKHLFLLRFGSIYVQFMYNKFQSEQLTINEWTQLISIYVIVQVSSSNYT